MSRVESQLSWLTDVKLLVVRLAACAALACLMAMASACGSRAGTVGVPTSPPAEKLPPAPTAPPVIPEPPTAPPPPPPPPPRAPESRPDECALIATSGEPIATVGLTERIDPSHAPRPSNESERLLFRQLYETLVRADCTGRVLPGLATSWRLDRDGQTWILTLRENARFSDGTPVTSADIRASWIRDGSANELRPEVSRLVQAIVAVDDRTLAIRLQRTRADVPLPLAHSDLSIVKPAADSPWPLGTRAARILPEIDTSTTIAIDRDTLPAIRFVVASGDPRDLLDRGVDLLLTRNPAALDYAATLPSFQSVPLAWHRMHVLLSPGRARSSPMLSDDQRQILADDAVRGEARGAQGPFWWQVATDCEVPIAPAVDAKVPAADAKASALRERSQPLTPRIVYDASDSVARDLAERFVGLVRASSPGATAFLEVMLPDRPRRTYQRATGLTGEALALARRLGTDAGYVIAVDRQPIDPCRDVKVLSEQARWLDPETIVALVETRLHAIVRRGRSRVTTEWDGGLIIAPAEMR